MAYGQIYCDENDDCSLLLQLYSYFLIFLANIYFYFLKLKFLNFIISELIIIHFFKINLNFQYAINLEINIMGVKKIS